MRKGCDGEWKKWWKKKNNNNNGGNSGHYVVARRPPNGDRLQCRRSCQFGNLENRCWIGGLNWKSSKLHLSRWNHEVVSFLVINTNSEMKQTHKATCWCCSAPQKHFTTKNIFLAIYLLTQNYFAHKHSFWVITIFVFVLEAKFFVTTNFLDIAFLF